MTSGESPRVGIIGGGIAGLSAAWYASRHGADVTIFEAADHLGGLGMTFDLDGQPVEKFYHCMLPSDKHLLSLLTDIGLADHVYWKETSFALMQNGRLYGLNNPLELLRFRPLSFIDRLRVGLTGAWGTVRSSRGLDDITCEQWLTRLSGRQAFDKFWKPMLQAKFGDRYQQVPALWFWTRFNREKGAKVERKGYLPGGYRRITQTLAGRLRDDGVDIRLNTGVSRIDLSTPGQAAITDGNGQHVVFDKVIYTGPVAQFSSMIADPGLHNQTGRDIDMQGVINAVVTLKKGLTPHYWVATVDQDIPFQGIVEVSNLLRPDDTNQAHRIYLMNYVHRSDAMFADSDDAIIGRYLHGLRRLFPDWDDGDVIDARVFRSPFVEPIYTLGYGKSMPPTSMAAGRLHMATTAQVYPQVTSWNGSVGLSHRVVENMFLHHAHSGTDTRGPIGNTHTSRPDEPRRVEA